MTARLTAKVAADHVDSTTSSEAGVRCSCGWDDTHAAFPAEAFVEHIARETILAAARELEAYRVAGGAYGQQNRRPHGFRHAAEVLLLRSGEAL